MTYKVRLRDGKMDVVDEKGDVVAHARITTIRQPSRQTHGPFGAKNYPSGPQTAEIVVGGKTIRDVPIFQG